MMRIFLLNFLSPVLILISLAGYSQDFTKDYTPLTSSGNLPEDFIESASVKALKDVEKLKKKGEKNLKEKRKFIISNAFFLDNVLKSGKVLYGDPIGKYVSSVADEVLKTDKSTREKLRFYVVKSSVVNAFSFDNGIILITTGLISQLENEAQLAFVISHEVVHYKKKHSISAHLEFISMNKKRRSFNRNGTNLLLEKSKYSRKQESQADEEGLKIFQGTSYSYKSIDGLFDVLQYSYLPFEDIEFDKKYFNDQNFVIPSSYYLDQVKDIHSDDNYNDSLSTHPNIKKRRELIADKISGLDNTGRKEFVISEKEFNSARDLSRFETCRLYMQDLDYPEAIYSAYALLKTYPDNVYLKKIIARSLYEVALYKSEYDRYTYGWEYKHGTISYYKKKAKSSVDRIIDFVDSIQGSSQQVFHLLQKLSPLEATVLALNNNWKLYQSEGYNDSYTGEICDSLMHILASKHQTKLEDFSKIKKPDTPADTAAAKTAVADSKTTGKKSSSKYDKIRKKATKNKISDDSFCKYAFVDILGDKKFTDMYAEAMNSTKNAKKSGTEIAASGTKAKSAKPAPKTTASKTTTSHGPASKSSPKSSTASKSKTKSKKDSSSEDASDDASDETAAADSVAIDKKEVENMNKESSDNYKSLTDFKMLGIDRVVIVDPTFMKLDERKKDQMQYFSGDQRLKYFTSLLEDNADLIHLSYDMLCPSTFEAGDVEKYNNLSYINDWISEKLEHGNFNNALVLNREFKNYLKTKFGTEYFLWSGVITLRKKKHVAGMILLTLLTDGLLLPYTVYYTATPSYNTYYYSLLFNIETGKAELFSEHEIDMRDMRCVLNSMIYDTFYQIKTPKKK